MALRHNSGVRGQVSGVRAWGAVIALVALFSGCCAGLVHPAREPAPEAGNAPPAVDLKTADADELVQVTRVIDGDTIEVELHGEIERVRLLCIDTPERGQDGYAEATEYLRGLIGDGVRLEKDPEHGHRDNFGRLLRYVWVGDVLINVEMVRAGHSAYATRWGQSSLYGGLFQGAARASD